MDGRVDDGGWGLTPVIAHPHMHIFTYTYMHNAARTLLPVLCHGEPQDDGPHQPEQELLVGVHHVRGADVGELEPLLVEVLDWFLCGYGVGV